MLKSHHAPSPHKPKPCLTQKIKKKIKKNH